MSDVKLHTTSLPRTAASVGIVYNAGALVCSLRSHVVAKVIPGGNNGNYRGSTRQLPGARLTQTEPPTT